MQPWLSPDVQRRLVPVEGDAVDGALHLARRRHQERITSAMPTEHISPRYVDLDTWSTAEIIAAMYEGQLAAAAAVRAALAPLARPSMTQCRPCSGAADRLCRRRHLGTDRPPRWNRAHANLRLALRSPGLCHGRRHGCADQERRKCRRQ